MTLRGRKRRIGKLVIHVDEELWKQCKAHYVTDADIIREFNRFQTLGINVNRATAAAAALREKKRGSIW